MHNSNSQPTWHGILTRLNSMMWDEELTSLLFEDDPSIRNVSELSTVALRAVIQNLEAKKAEGIPLHEALWEELQEHKQNHMSAHLEARFHDTHPEKEIDHSHQFITRFLDRSLQEMKHTEKDI